MKTTILALITGAISGIIAALCGVGGGIVMVPAFKGMLDLDQKQAVATSLAIIVPTALIATFRNATGSQPLVDWRIVLPAAIGACLAAFFAADWMRSLSNVTLSRIFALVLIGLGLKMLFSKP